MTCYITIGCIPVKQGTVYHHSLNFNSNMFFFSNFLPIGKTIPTSFYQHFKTPNSYWFRWPFVLVSKLILDSIDLQHRRKNVRRVSADLVLASFQQCLKVFPGDMIQAISWRSINHPFRGDLANQNWDLANTKKGCCCLVSGSGMSTTYKRMGDPVTSPDRAVASGMWPCWKSHQYFQQKHREFPPCQVSLPSRTKW